MPWPSGCRRVLGSSRRQGSAVPSTVSDVGATLSVASSQWQQGPNQAQQNDGQPFAALLDATTAAPTPAVTPPTTPPTNPPPQPANQAQASSQTQASNQTQTATGGTSQSAGPPASLPTSSTTT